MTCPICAADFSSQIVNYVVEIFEDNKGSLVFGTPLAFPNMAGRCLQVSQKKEGLCHDRVSNLMIDRAGYIWVGTWGRVCLCEGAALFSNTKPPKNIPQQIISGNLPRDLAQPMQRLSNIHRDKVQSDLLLKTGRIACGLSSTCPSACK